MGKPKLSKRAKQIASLVASGAALTTILLATRKKSNGMQDLQKRFTTEAFMQQVVSGKIYDSNTKKKIVPIAGSNLDKQYLWFDEDSSFF